MEYHGILHVYLTPFLLKYNKIKVIYLKTFLQFYGSLSLYNFPSYPRKNNQQCNGGWSREVMLNSVNSSPQ